jgi:hypothetical protein
MKPRRNQAKRDSDPRFARVAAAFARKRGVTQGGDKGFGAGALKVNGKIFAMISSKGNFVVKLPKDRVDDLAMRGAAERFDPGRRRIMKEWAVITGNADWVALAKEACEFVKGTKP